ncbi:MAG: 30S ribosomal protein THX [Deltaproteobacteria bacterium]|nr:30S ribosomal protein THX [Deltaproteobacteria bacterium]
MGKGDKRTKRGKINKASHGIARPKLRTKRSNAKKAAKKK